MNKKTFIQLYANIKYDNILDESRFQHDKAKVKVAVAVLRKMLPLIQPLISRLVNLRAFGLVSFYQFNYTPSPRKLCWGYTVLTLSFLPPIRPLVRKTSNL